MRKVFLIGGFALIFVAIIFPIIIATLNMITLDNCWVWFIVAVLLSVMGVLSIKHSVEGD